MKAGFAYTQVWFKTDFTALLYTLHDTDSNPNPVLFIYLARQATYA